jgi:hypothetical protein
LIQREAHGASFTTLKENDVSNAMLTNTYTKGSDKFFRFVVVGRQTAYQHQLTYIDGSQIKNMKFATDVVTIGNQHWHIS